MEIMKSCYQKMNNDGIEYLKLKDKIKDIKICEKAYEIMIEHDVRKDIILRPLYYLFIKNHLSILELKIRLKICNIKDFEMNINENCNFSDIEKYLKEKLEIEEHNHKLPNNYMYLGYKPMQYWIKEGVAPYIAWFYKGYSPYAYNINDQMYHNIAYYLKENDFS